jgi:hypothetical protein
VGFLQGLTGQAGSDQVDGLGAGGDVVMWAVQPVGDDFLGGLGLGDLFVEVGELAWARLRQLSTAGVRDPRKALDSPSENPTS